MSHKPLWVGYLTDKNYDFSNKKQSYGIPPTYFIKKFSIYKSVKKAVIDISALGVFSAFLNDLEINHDFMAPGWTEYSKTINYFSYNISNNFLLGENILSFIVADGWYASSLSDVGKNNFGDYPLKLWFRLKLTFDDGSTSLICSDGTEKASRCNIVYCDNQNGIKIDNTIDYKNLPFFDVSIFDIIQPTKSLNSKIIANEVFVGKLISNNEEYRIFDFGQNFSGVIDLSYIGNIGQKITIKYGEMLYDNGDLYTENLRGAIATDTLIVGSNRQERFYTKLLFHGFRFVKIICPKNVIITNIFGVAVYNKLVRVGFFNSNNSLFNKLYNNVLWAQRSNFLSIPTDCPQRDERLGWTGDAQIFCKTAMLNYDCSKFYKKYIYDLCDSIDIYGKQVPVAVPYLFDFLKYKNEVYLGWAGWSDAIVIIPYQYYLFYGDLNILKNTYVHAEDYINSMLDRANDFILDIPSYGDWLYIDEELDKVVFNTLYLAFSVSLLAKISRILGFESKFVFYNNLFFNIKNSFCKSFIDKKGIIKSDVQSAYILSYAFGLIDKKSAKNNIVRKLKQFGNRLTTGFHGTKFLLPVLCDLGLSTVAYDLALRVDYPSWGYMISCGATTFWERWDSFSKNNGFNKDGMNSFNHYSLGSIGEWFYTHVLGVNIDERGAAYKSIIVKPYFDIRLDNVSGSIKTKYGCILVMYSIENGRVYYRIDIPLEINCTFDFNNKILNKYSIIHKKHNRFVFELLYGD